MRGDIVLFVALACACSKTHFNFASGFQGTDEHFKAFYVIVYYPGP